MTQPSGGQSEFPRPPEGNDERREAKRIHPQGWIAKITFPRTFLGFGGGQSINAPLLDLSQNGARVLLQTGISKGSQLRIHIEDPKFKDVVEWMAEAIWVNPPPPVANTWVIGLEFVDLPRDLQLKIDGWLSYYGSEQYRLSLEKPTAILETRARFPGRPDQIRETRSRKAVHPEGRETKARRSGRGDPVRETKSRRAVRPDDGSNKR